MHSISLFRFTLFVLLTINGFSYAQDSPFIVVLGTIQDAGSPHIGCSKECCKSLFEKPISIRKVVSLGLVDPYVKKAWLFEATPDLPAQLKTLKKHSIFKNTETPDGIFLTHAHIGHYTGLMYLGKEALNSNNISVYAMPRMKSFLEGNGPWSQLVGQKNILLKPMADQKEVVLSKNVAVTPFLVPHRDEFSETVGYKINGPNKTLLFIPDIDKWEKWSVSIIDEIKQVDYAFVDATFFDGNEIQLRDISEIPHPFVIESLKLFKDLSKEDKDKIYFIHFNHTNPLINRESDQAKEVLNAGFNIAVINQVIKL